MRRHVSCIAATGLMGTGFLESSLRRGIDAGVDFVGCDAGSVDNGPATLGGEVPFFGRSGYKRDLRLLMLAARGAGIPLVVGSAGGSGSRPHLDSTRQIVEEIAREEGLRFRLGLVDAEQDRETLHEALRSGRIRPLGRSAELSPEVIDSSTHIVAMLGPEPLQDVLDAGAEVVIAGRTSDSSIYAAIPLRDGIAPGPVYHAAKTIESGAAPVEQRMHPDCIMAAIDDEGFVVTPLNEAMRCTPRSVAAHTLYENQDPNRIPEPGGVLDTSGAEYTAVDERCVRVIGSVFERSDAYTVKLEGAELIGYQSVGIATVRDPMILRQFDSWRERLETRVHERLAEIYSGVPPSYEFRLRVYGGDPVRGREGDGWAPRELCMLFDITAETQELASTMTLTARHVFLHHPVPEWSGLLCTAAMPYSPHVIDRGAVHRFTLNHVMELRDPLAASSAEIVDV
jgi:hypothetical protein